MLKLNGDLVLFSKNNTNRPSSVVKNSGTRTPSHKDYCYRLTLMSSLLCTRVYYVTCRAKFCIGTFYKFEFCSDELVGHSTFSVNPNPTCRNRGFVEQIFV